jgi:hypothetical protein
MANTADNIRTGVTGAVYKAPLATSLPASLNAATTGFTDLGYVNEDGVTESQPTDTNDIKAWQNGDVVRRVQKSHELTYKFTLLETSPTVQALVYGTSPLTGTPLEMTGDPLLHHAFVIDVEDGTHKRRICIPDGAITERPEVVYSNADATAYAVTITCYPDASGNKAYVYLGAAA